MNPRGQTGKRKQSAQAATIGAWVALCFVPACLSAQAGHPAVMRQETHQAPQPSQQGRSQKMQGPPGRDGFGGQNGGQNHAQHLSQWMDSHRSQPLDEQQKALAAEPGFRTLPQQQQQRMHDRLTQLNHMTPDQQRRTLDRTEQMSRLSPPERQQVRGAMQQLGSLPEDRRRAVARTYRQLNALPPEQRNAYLNSPQYRGQFNDQERSTMGNLLAVSPLLPQSSPAGAQQGGGQQGPR